MNKKYSPYFLGLDIGTDSVGWCVTDHEYNVLRYKGNGMWGVSLFDEAKQSKERRGFRIARRRINRVKQRVLFLEELFAKEIAKTDPDFFIRRRESALWAEDKSYSSYPSVFGDSYTDKQYYKDYPTIHHLICELMDNPKPHDVRLVFTACAWLVAHRGHFLYEADANSYKLPDISETYKQLTDWFISREYDTPFECNPTAFGEVLKSDKRVSVRENNFKNLLWKGKKPVEEEDFPVNKLLLIKMISGAKIKLSKLFKNEEYNELEQNDLTVAAADFEEILDKIRADISDDEAELLCIAQAIYNWGLLADILGEHEYISKAKVEIYKTHNKDLKMLKSVIKKYCPDKYAEVFRIADSEIDNYVKYSANLRQVDITASKFKKCSAEDFCKYICGILKDVVPQEEDKPAFDDILHKLELNTLCPKQVTSDNRVIPYQLYYIELKKILENAADYLPFLKQTDEYGSVSDKILSIMTYRIPYYVGPINSHSSHAWIERKLGKIYPWNFSDMVDLDESEEKFIRRMTAKCTYCAGEDVLPKNSLLYCKFTVLDEINNICVNGERISPEIKQGIYENVFMKHKKVTLKKIHDYLVKEGLFNEKTDKLDGIDITVKSNLKPWIDFGRLMTAGVLTEEEAEDIIKRITITTDKKRLKSWLKMRYGKLSENDILYICGLGYKDYGRLSRKFLAEISEIDAKSGEIIGESIINSLWSGSENHMELLSDRHGYKHQLEQMNTVYYRDKHSTLEERLSEMYIPTAVRRAVIRTLDIAKELNRLTEPLRQKYL